MSEPSSSKRRSPFSISYDIDATLLCSDSDMTVFSKLEIYSNPKRAPLRSRVYVLEMVDPVPDKDWPLGSGNKSRMWGVYRPHLFKFMNFCAWYLKSAIVWSAGMERYVDAVSDLIFRDESFQPLALLNRTDCVIGDNVIHKPLDKLLTRTDLQGKVDLSKLFHLDDRDDTFELNPGNGILIPAYEPRLRLGSQYSLETVVSEIMKDDICLLQLMCWLSLPQVMTTEDVRTLDKRFIFSTSLETYQSVLRENVKYSLPKSIPNELQSAGKLIQVRG